MLVEPPDLPPGKSPHTATHVCEMVLMNVRRIFNVKGAHERSGKVQVSIDCNENLVVKLPRSSDMEGCKRAEAFVPLIADPQTVDDFHV